MKPALILAASALLYLPTAPAADLQAGDRLLVTASAYVDDSYGNITDVTGGSYFAFDYNADSKITGVEKTPEAPGFLSGIVIGATSTPGASHPGAPLPTDSNATTAPFYFFGGTGSDYLTRPVTGGTSSGLDFSGWRFAWKGDVDISLGSGAWGTGYADGVANFIWDGVYGHAYTLTYRAAVPDGDPSGFGAVKYHLFLTGTVQAVPEAETWAMLLVGLGLVGSAAARRRNRDTNAPVCRQTPANQRRRT